MGVELFLLGSSSLLGRPRPWLWPLYLEVGGGRPCLAVWNVLNVELLLLRLLLYAGLPCLLAGDSCTP